MELNSFLFGNIDEEGKLENEDLDEETRRYLSQFSVQRETKDLIKQIFESDQSSHSLSEQIISEEKKAATSVKALVEAVDYSDIKEEIEETDPYVLPRTSFQPLHTERDLRPPAIKTDISYSREIPDFSNEDFEDLFQDVQTQPVQRETTAESLLPELKEFLEDYKSNKNVKFTSLYFSCHPNDTVPTVNLPVGSAMKKAKFKKREENTNVDYNTEDLLVLPAKEIELKVKPAPKISFKGPPVVGAAVAAAQRQQQAASLKKSLPAKLSQTQLSWVRWEESQKKLIGTNASQHAYLDKPFEANLAGDKNFNFQLVPWENKAQALINGREEKPLAPYLLQRPYLLPHNWDLEKSSWEESVIFDEKELPKSIPILNLTLNMNDPYLLFDRLSQEDIAKRLSKAERILSKRIKRIRKAQKAATLQHTSSSENLAASTLAAIISNPSQYFSKPHTDKLNISNDRFYESVKEQKSSIHSAFEKVTLHHSIPALKLQPPHFKCSLSKPELRSFHRPKLIFSIGDKIIFSHLKENKKAKKNREFGEVIKNSKGLSLRDDTPFVLFEFSEELPLLMNCSGMGNLLNIYYRKKSSKDDYFPENFELGIPTILEPTESGPFMGFVEIQPGQEMNVLYNNMYRAATFKHSPSSTDFLLVKYTRENHSVYYLRDIPYLYVVGQTLPCMEVFGPHSRKLNMFSRNRIQVASYRYFFKRDNPRRRFKIVTLTNLFPQFSEGTIRKWLKEYAESSRQGIDSGYWVMKNNAPNLAEEEIQQLVTPEAICQYESMLVGQQRLIDTGHSATVADFVAQDSESTASYMQSSMDDDDQDNLIDDELKLTPWNLTNNFLTATQGKAMLELHGIGDPTGMGEGFSFLKIPLKTQIASRQVFDSPKKQSQKQQFYHKATQSDQQAAYKREIYKIWEKAISSLSSTSTMTSTSLPHSSSSQSVNSEVKEPLSDSEETSTLQTIEESLKQAASDPKLVPRQFRGKKLTITRKIKCPDGSVSSESEVICDSRVIDAYLEFKQENKTKVLISTLPTSKETKDSSDAVHSAQPSTSIVISNLSAIPSTATAKKRSIPPSPLFMSAASASASTAKSIQLTSGKQSQGSLGEKPSKGTSEKAVRCGACGQTGHMRTNKACPLFNEDTSRSSPSESLLSSSIKKAPSSKSLILKIPGGQTPTIKLVPKPPLAKINRIFERIISHLTAIPDSWPFHKPVDARYAPSYYEIIPNPIDLSTIKHRCASNSYLNREMFLEDLKLMHSNCIKYNGPDHPFCQTAHAIYTKAVQLIEERSSAIQKATNSSVSVQEVGKDHDIDIV